MAVGPTQLDRDAVARLAVGERSRIAEFHNPISYVGANYVFGAAAKKRRPLGAVLTRADRRTVNTRTAAGVGARAA